MQCTLRFSAAAGNKVEIKGLYTRENNLATTIYLLLRSGKNKECPNYMIHDTTLVGTDRPWLNRCPFCHKMLKSGNYEFHRSIMMSAPAERP